MAKLHITSGVATGPLYKQVHPLLLLSPACVCSSPENDEQWGKGLS